MAIAINGSGTLTGVSVGGLPDGIVDTDMIAASAVTVAKASGSVKGIQEFDMWRVNADFSQATADITANWERADTNFDKIGTGLTESSGVFTFPSTGKWFVGFSIYSWNSGEVDYIGGKILLAGNIRTEALTSHSADTLSANAYTTTCFDITDTSSQTMKFMTVAPTSSSFNGNTSEQRTGFWTMKVGDT